MLAHNKKNTASSLLKKVATILYVRHVRGSPMSVFDPMMFGAQPRQCIYLNILPLVTRLFTRGLLRTAQAHSIRTKVLFDKQHSTLSSTKDKYGINKLSYTQRTSKNFKRKPRLGGRWD